MGMNAPQAAPKLLVVGGGGREHAICWRLRQDRPHAEIYCAPGNAGTADVARTLDIGAGDVADLVAWCRSERPDMVVVGPEDPLIDGLVDELQAIGVPAFGPTRGAAAIEGSKAFSSALVTRLGVPAPDHATFDNVDEALAYVEDEPGGVVVKADGPALGKGVIVCSTPDEAGDAIRRMMVDGAFGASGARVVVQERLHGPELSVFALSDGIRFRTIGVARDYKRIGEGDRGPNTGGIGSYTPVPDASAELVTRIEREIIAPVLAGLRAAGRPYVGLLYAGLILTADGPKVIEFNCRMGDPETQVVLPVLQGDFVDLIDAAVGGALDRASVGQPTQAAVAVVLTSKATQARPKAVTRSPGWTPSTPVLCFTPAPNGVTAGCGRRVDASSRRWAWEMTWLRRATRPTPSPLRFTLKARDTGRTSPPMRSARRSRRDSPLHPTRDGRHLGPPDVLRISAPRRAGRGQCLGA